MNQTMYTAISGMNAFQQALSVTSNNIANANTTGYKKQSVVFNDLLYQNTMGSVAGGLYAGTNPMSFGSGSKIGAILTDYTAGSPTSTGRNKDGITRSRFSSLVTTLAAISFTHVTVVLQYLTTII